MEWRWIAEFQDFKMLKKNLKAFKKQKTCSLFITNP